MSNQQFLKGYAEALRDVERHFRYALEENNQGKTVLDVVGAFARVQKYVGDSRSGIEHELAHTEKEETKQQEMMKSFFPFIVPMPQNAPCNPKGGF